MSMFDISNDLITMLEQMEDEELEAILKEDAASLNNRKLSDDEILRISTVLAKRKRNENQIPQSAERSYHQFCQYHCAMKDAEMKRSYGKNKSMRIIAAVFSVVIVLSVSGRVLGSDFWSVFTKWSSDTLSFSFQDTGEQEMLGTPESPYDNFRDTIKMLDFPEKGVPEYLNHCELKDLIVEETPVCNTMFAVFQDKDGSMIKFSMKSGSNITSEQFEYSSHYIEVFGLPELNSEVYIFQDNSQYKGVWKYENTEHYIISDKSLDDIKEILNTI